MKRVLSGVQPTGSLHLGNYLGAIRQWVVNQDLYQNFFCVVDLHAITATHDPKLLANETRQAAAMYIACGIDPTKSKIFVQSHVKAHAEMAWLLNCTTPIGWLERMVQYKEKSKIQGENCSMGLFGYPVLMAADILLYQTDLVPVGEDQLQHLELSRDICRRFNSKYTLTDNLEVFKEPTALIMQEGARIMSIQDGSVKMSKSAPNDNSRINLLDPPDLIAKKFRRCKTDSQSGLSYDDLSRPECVNLLNIYQACTDSTKEQVMTECSQLQWGPFKSRLTDAVINKLQPIQASYWSIVQDQVYLDRVLEQGRQAATLVSDDTLAKAKVAMGFLLPPLS